MLKLEIENEGGAREVDLPASGTLAVGRVASNDIRVDGDENVSRRHMTVTVECGKVTVADAGSTFGTHVNGVRVEGPTELRPGDRVRIGSTTLTLVGDEAPPARGDAAGGRFYTSEILALQARIHGIILSRINAGAKAGNISADRELAARAEQCLDDVLQELRHELPRNVSIDEFRRSVIDELLGYGPISPLLRDPAVSEIMVNGPDRVFIESNGLLHETDARFMDEGHLVQIIKRIVEPLGRHVDDASPMVDARLPDGSRVNAVVPPLALDGASLTIRKFADRKLTTDDLIGFGSLTSEMALFLEEAVRQRQNILVSGGTGSGKTTLLNILSQFIPEGERLVTIEDSAELKLSHRNIVRLEARPANIEGKGRVAIRDLVVNSLRMRPDRIIVGECRGPEALDMLQAMNTGHDGSLTTAHANNPRDAMSRLENMVMMAGYDLPSSAIREQIASAIDIVVQQTRMGDGSRKVVKIVEVTGREGDVIQMQDIFEFKQTGYDPGGRIRGYYTATGNIPRFVEELRERDALALDMGVFVPKN